MHRTFSSKGRISVCLGPRSCLKTSDVRYFFLPLQEFRPRFIDSPAHSLIYSVWATLWLKYLETHTRAWERERVGGRNETSYTGSVKNKLVRATDVIDDRCAKFCNLGRLHMSDWTKYFKYTQWKGLFFFLLDRRARAQRSASVSYPACWVARQTIEVTVTLESLNEN